MVDKLIDCADLYGSIAKIATSVVSNPSNFGSPLVLRCRADGVVFILKIMEYTKIDQITKPKSGKCEYLNAPDNEVRTLRLLRERVIRKGITPCIIELLSAKVCENSLGQADSFKDTLLTDVTGVDYVVQRRISRIWSFHVNGVAENRVCIAAYEECQWTLGSYLYYVRDDAIGETVIRAILWMLLWTLYVLDREFPGFDHHDLHVANIMIWTDRQYTLKDGIKYLEFRRDDDHIYYVPFMGILPKIIDFEDAAVPSEGFQSNGLTHFAGKSHNRDVDTLFAGIYINTHTQMGTGANDKYIIRLLSELSPTKYFSKVLQLTGQANTPSPADLINHKAFEDYRQTKTDALIYSRYGYKK